MDSYNPKTWNYDTPNNSWESWSWQFRWLAAAGATAYFGGGFLAGIVMLLRS